MQYSVVGLGFGMNIYESLASGREGMIFTIISVAGTLAIGMFIGRKLLKVDKETAYMISAGTAICGGIREKEDLDSGYVPTHRRNTEDC